MSLKFSKTCLWGLAAAAAAFVIYQYLRPLPAVLPLSRLPAAPKTAAISLPWPAAGQAALGADGYGLLESHGASAPASTASIAKIITALAVLQKKPLASGDQGPAITMDATDVGYFNYYYTNGGSVAKVAAGEQISQYQALQALLLPSANNMGDSLARWAFGSVDAYKTYAQQMVNGMGLSQTTVGNTNGFDDTTTSTADDLVKLGLQALKNPVIADIVSQQSAVIPVQGLVKNVNWLLGSYGIVGIKTGNTDKAGGCYLFAAKHQVLGRQITLVGAVMGAPDLSAAITAGRDLVSAADSGFAKLTIVKRGQVLATYSAPWGASAQLKSAKDLSLLVWRGRDIRVSANFDSILPGSSAAADTVSAAGSSQSASSPVYLSQPLAGPSWHWRLFRK